MSRTKRAAVERDGRNIRLEEQPCLTMVCRTRGTKRKTTHPGRLAGEQHEGNLR